MNPQIEFTKQRIKDLEWSLAYHTKQLLDAQTELDIFQKELDKLQEKEAHKEFA